MKMSMFDKGIELVDRAIELKPFYEEGWQLKMNMHYQLALAYLKMMSMRMPRSTSIWHLV